MSDTEAPLTPREAGAAPAESADVATGAEARAEAEAANERLLRALAEMENLRRRTQREVADARVYGIAAFARDVLGAADNMTRALATVSADVRAAADPAIRALIEGIELTERDLLNVLDKHGIKRIEPQGERFDPHFHQAMFEVDDSSVAPGTVVRVMQPGYTIGERILRPAMVAVAKGGAKGAPAAANDA
jgi:molecular chaperone GrpE